MSSPVEKGPLSPSPGKKWTSRGTAGYVSLYTFITMELGVMGAGRPVRKSSTFPASSVHLRPSRHPEFCPRFVYFRSKRSLYLGRWKSL